MTALMDLVDERRGRSLARREERKNLDPLMT